MSEWTVHVFGERPETVALATVTREEGCTRICVQPPEGQPPQGGYGTIRLADPVSLDAGEHVVIEVPYAAFGWPEPCPSEFTASSALTVTALHAPRVPAWR